MVRNAIHFLLVCVVMFILYLPVREYLILRTVTAEFDALHEFLGEFEIVDPKKVHIRALHVNKPLEYAWRVYLPENMTFAKSEIISSTNYSGGSSSESMSRLQGVPARQFVLSYKLNIESSYISVHSRGGDFNGATYSSINSQTSSEMILNSLDPSHTRARQFAIGETIQLEEGQKVQLLLVENLTAESLDKPIKPLLKVRIAPIPIFIGNSNAKQKSDRTNYFWED